MEKLSDLLEMAKVSDIIATKKEKEDNKIVWALAIIGAIAAVAGIAFAVYKYLTPDYMDDFDEDFDDDLFDEEEEDYEDDDFDNGVDSDYDDDDDYDDEPVSGKTQNLKKAGKSKKSKKASDDDYDVDFIDL